MASRQSFSMSAAVASGFNKVWSMYFAKAAAFNDSDMEQSSSEGSRPCRMTCSQRQTFRAGERFQPRAPKNLLHTKMRLPIFRAPFLGNGLGRSVRKQLRRFLSG